VNSGDMEVQKKKKKRAPLVTGRRKSARLWLLEKFICAPLVTVLEQLGKKAAPTCFFFPCVVNAVNNGVHVQ